MTKTEKKLVRQALAKIVNTPSTKITLLESWGNETNLEGYLFEVIHNAALRVEYTADVYKTHGGHYLATGLQAVEIHHPE